MDLFGLKEHERQHQEGEKYIRQLYEQVAQLTIDLGETRVELRELQLEVEGKVSADEIDPSLVGLNEGIKRARVRLNEAQESAEESWNELSEGLGEALDDLREQWEDSSKNEGDSKD